MDIKIINKENDITFINVKNDNALDVTFSSLGASIFRIDFNKTVMTLTNEDYHDFFHANNYLGKTIGRIANRVKDGVIEIEGKSYQLDCNENENSLHSGRNGLSNKVFIPSIEQKANSLIVSFSYLSKEKDDILPGDVNFEITYEVLKEENIIKLTLKATPTKDTVLALTNHSFFTLGESSNENLKLFVDASTYIECGKDDLLPLKTEVINNALNFKTKKAIGEDIKDPSIYFHKARGYDHDFIFDHHGLEYKNLTLETDKYFLDIRSDFESVQIYSCNYAFNEKTINSKSNIYQGVAIEPQDSLLNRRLLAANTTYLRHINYHFIKKD